MEKKEFEITYNPYTNSISFRQQIGIDENEQVIWGDIEPDSQLMRFQQQRCIFENCVEDIIDPINKYYNTSNEFCVVFNGTDEDYAALNKAIQCSTNTKSSMINTVHNERYLSSSIVLNEIIKAYEQIKSEFVDYIDNHDSSIKEDDERLEIGKAITKFNDTVRSVIPVCIIGNYSVGKSALVNAIIGKEILPSQASSTTAKNVVICNGDRYTVQFKYQNSDYVLEISDSIDIKCTDDTDNGLIEELVSGTEGLSGEDSIVHKIVENLNYGTNNRTKVADIEGSLYVTIPFYNSELDTANYSFEITDTPGSNKSEELERIHRKNLEDLMDEQTNALPIFVMDLKSIESGDNNDLITLLESKKAGFALHNCIIAISMSDLLVERQLSEEVPQKIEQWLPHPTIMYVSPIAAIGEKKLDKDNWIDLAYKQIYETKTDDLIDTIPPRYNHTPCGREIEEERRQQLSKLLYASGIPSLETEMNYYAYRFAEYKKCFNSRQYLLDALEMADEKLLEAKENQEHERENRKKDQKKQRDRIIKEIDAINPPSPNPIVRKVKPLADRYLADYCSGVERTARIIWQRCRDEKNPRKLFQDAMVYNCQKNLYDKCAPEIKEKIKQTLSVLASEYMEKVRETEKKEYNRLSEEAQKELDSLFVGYERGPVLKDVSFGKLELLRQLILVSLPFEKAHDAFVRRFVKKFCEILNGEENYERQCITDPVRQYCKQVNDWTRLYRKKVKETLDKDSAILSEYDALIRQNDEKIKDMSNRIGNLSDVKVKLKNIIPE